MKLDKVAIAVVMREVGWLYFINTDGNIARMRMVRSGKRKPGDKPEVVVKTKIVRDIENYIYFLDDDGDISRHPRSHAGKPRKIKEKPIPKKKTDYTKCESCSIKISLESAYADSEHCIYQCANCAVKMITSRFNDEIKGLNLQIQSLESKNALLETWPPIISKKAIILR